MDRGQLYKSIIGLLLGVSLLAFGISPVAECPEEVAQVPAYPAPGWGYYHHDMLERICAVTITDTGGEHVYLYAAAGDADYSLDWMGPNILWIDNLGGVKVDKVSYWIGENGRAVRLWLPMVGR